MKSARLKASYERPLNRAVSISRKSEQHPFSPNNIDANSKEEVMRIYTNLFNLLFFKEMYGDQCREFVRGKWGLKSWVPVSFLSRVYVLSSWIWARIIPTLICCKTLTLKCSLHQLQWMNMLAICWDVPITSQMAVDICGKEAIRNNRDNPLQDGHLLDRQYVSVLERCPSYSESTKRGVKIGSDPL